MNYFFEKAYPVLDKIYPVLSSIVISSSIFLWSIEFGPNRYDVGINVYVSIISLIIYVPYIIRNFDPFPLILSTIFFLYHIIWSSINGFDVRSTLTCIFFSIYFYGVYYSIKISFNEKFFIFRKMILFFLIAQLSLQILQVFGLFLLYNSTTIGQNGLLSIGATGFFSEGSHVAISIVPLMFVKDDHGRHINLYSIIVIICLILGPSSTAILGILLLFVLLILKVNSWRQIMLAALLIVGTLSLAVVSREIFHVHFFAPIADRVWGIFQILGGRIEPGVNLSSLVYANGISMAWAGLKDILGSGLGHFDIYYDQSISRHAIERITHGVLNKDDGSSVVFKMIGEMGVLGLFIVVYFLFNCLMIINKYEDCILSVFACFLIMAGIRSAGYFHGPYILSFALVGVLWQIGVLWPRRLLNRQNAPE